MVAMVLSNHRYYYRPSILTAAVFHVRYYSVHQLIQLTYKLLIQIGLVAIAMDLVELTQRMAEEKLIIWIYVWLIY